MPVSEFIVKLVVFCWAGEIFTPLWAQGWLELVVDVKLGQLRGPKGCEHHILPHAGLSAASVLCQALSQADSCSQAFPAVRLPFAFFGATLLLQGAELFACLPSKSLLLLTGAAAHG